MIVCVLQINISLSLSLSPSQHGFLKNKSTCTNLLECLNDWSSITDKAKEALILYVDFFKAFDSVSVPKLILKLNSLGIANNILKCISSLLSNRFTRVRVGQALSSLRPVVSGVQQGSILGPVMFILFMNDLHNYLPIRAVSKLFADDFKSYISVSNDDDVHDFNVIIAAVECWSKAWQLPISTDKCSWMLISHKMKKNKFTFFYF